MTHKVHDGARRLLALTVIAFNAATPEQTTRIEVLALPAQVTVDIGIIDRPVNGRGVGASDRQWPNCQFPIAHVQRSADDRPKLICIAIEHSGVLDRDVLRVGDELIDPHRFRHDTAEVFPMCQGNRIALCLRLFRKGNGQIGERPLVTLGIDDGGKPAPAPS